MQINGVDMAKLELIEDSVFLLYIIPIILNGLYALLLWSFMGFSSSLPIEVYLRVTKDPIVFLVGFVAICAALLLEIQANPKDTRITKIKENIYRLRVFAFLTIILSIICAWSASGYSSLLALLNVYVEGKFALIFPAILIGLSFALQPSIKYNLKLPSLIFEIIPLVLLIGSPLSLFLLSRLSFSSAFVIGFPFFILILAVILWIYGSFKYQKK